MDQNNGITSWLISHSGGSIKDNKQANKVLFGFVILIVIISIFLFSKTLSSGHSASTVGRTPFPGATPAQNQR